MKVRYFKDLEKKYFLRGCYIPWADEVHVDSSLSNHRKVVVVRHEKLHSMIRKRFGFSGVIFTKDGALTKLLEISAMSHNLAFWIEDYIEKKSR